MFAMIMLTTQPGWPPHVGAGDDWIIYEARALSSVFRDILPFFWDKYILEIETAESFGGHFSLSPELFHCLSFLAELEEALHHASTLHSDTGWLGRVSILAFVASRPASLLKTNKYLLASFELLLQVFRIRTVHLLFLCPKSMDYCSVFYPPSPLIPRDVS